MAALHDIACAVLISADSCADVLPHRPLVTSVENTASHDAASVGSTESLPFAMLASRSVSHACPITFTSWRNAYSGRVLSCALQHARYALKYATYVLSQK